MLSWWNIEQCGSSLIPKVDVLIVMLLQATCTAHEMADLQMDCTLMCAPIDKHQNASVCLPHWNVEFPIHHSTSTLIPDSNESKSRPKVFISWDEHHHPDSHWFDSIRCPSFSVCCLNTSTLTYIIMVSTIYMDLWPWFKSNVNHVQQMFIHVSIFCCLRINWYVLSVYHRRSIV